MRRIKIFFIIRTYCEKQIDGSGTSDKGRELLKSDKRRESCDS